MRRRLFNILSVLSLLVSVGMGVLWVRSYWVLEGVSYTTPRSGSASIVMLRVLSVRGYVVLTYSSDTGGQARGLQYGSQPASAGATPGRWRFSYGSGSDPARSWGEAWVPHWALLLASAILSILPAAWLIRDRERQWRIKHGLCLKCGYDLRASKERCPECGAAIPVERVAHEAKTSPTVSAKTPHTRT